MNELLKSFLKTLVKYLHINRGVIPTYLNRFSKPNRINIETAIDFWYMKCVPLKCLVDILVDVRLKMLYLPMPNFQNTTGL